MIVNFSSQDRQSLCKRVNCTQTLGGRAICDIEIVPQQISWAFVPFVGQPLEVISGGEYLFGGSIESVRQIKYTSTSIVGYSVTCADHHKILDRRLTGQREWSNVTAKQIIGDICNSYLTDEGVDGTTYVSDGITVEKFKLDYQTVAEAINELAKLSQYHWYIDHAKRLHFFSQGSSAAPVGFAAPCLNAERIDQVTSREGYSNHKVVRLGNYVRDSHTARFNEAGRIAEDGEQSDATQATDGSRKYFATTYPIVSKPRIWSGVGAIERTVGIDGVDTGLEWYWSSGSATVRQDDSGTPLALGATLWVEYIGQDNVSIAVQNDTEVDLRSGLEGNSGLYETLTDSAARVSGADATQYAESLLAQVDEHSVTTTVDTNDYKEPDCVAVRPGQSISISTVGYVGGSFVVRQVRWSAPSRYGNAHADVDCQIECVKGPILGDAVTFFQALAQTEGIVATPGALAPDTAITQPDQPDGTGWSVALGPSQADAYGVQQQRIDITVSRALPTGGDRFDIWYYEGSAAPADPFDWQWLTSTPPPDSGPLAWEYWVERRDAAFDLVYGLTVSGPSYDSIPSGTTPAKGPLTVPALANASAPSAGSVSATFQERNGIKFGRFEFSLTLPSDPNRGVIVSERWQTTIGFPASSNPHEPVSEYPAVEPAVLQAAGTFVWNQGGYEWPAPDNPEYWFFRLGAEDHRGEVTWLATTFQVTVSASGGINVTAMFAGKTGKGLGVVGGKLGETLTGLNVPNGGFEAAESGVVLDWSTQGSVIRDTAVFRTGVASMRLTRGAATALLYTTEQLRISAGQNLKCHVDIKLSVTGITPEVYCEFGDEGGVWTGYSPGATINTGTTAWQKVTVNAIAVPAAAVRMNIVVRLLAGAAAPFVNVDNVTLEPIPATSGGLETASDGTTRISDLGVTNAKLANLSVDAAKLVDGSVTGSKVLDGAIGTLKIAASAVTATRLADLAVEAAKLANSSVTATKIANAAVGSAAIAALAVGTAHIADAAINSAKIASLAVGTGAIQDAAITNVKIQDATIQSAKIVSLEAGKIAAGTITAAISITAPTIVATGAAFTVNIDSTNAVKVTNTSGQVVTLDAAGFKVRDSGGTTSVEATATVFTVYRSSGARLVLQAPSDVPQAYFYNSSNQYLRIYHSSFGVIECAQDNSFLSLSGQDSYVRAFVFRFGLYTVENLTLGSLTATRWFPAYDGFGNYLGKVPIIP